MRNWDSKARKNFADVNGTPFAGLVVLPTRLAKEVVSTTPRTQVSGEEFWEAKVMYVRWI